MADAQTCEPDDWCFECKDGGDLVVCDHGNCGKVYHIDCVPEEESSFENEEPWICGRHYCFNCRKSPKFYCLGCPHAVCFKCYAVAEFTVVRDGKGLCSDCLELVFIIENNMDHDSEGNKISLNDRETYEALFKEYWDIIKLKEGLTSGDVCAILTKYKMDPNSVHHRRFRNTDGDGGGGGGGCGGGGDEEEEEVEDEEGCIILDIDNHDLGPKRKRSKSEEFIGWESKFAQTKYNKDMNSLHQRRFGESEKERDKGGGEDGDKEGCIILGIDNHDLGPKRQRSKLEEFIGWAQGFGENEKDLTPCISIDDNWKHKAGTKRKGFEVQEFIGWGSKSVIAFLTSIGKDINKPLSRWGVNLLIHEYIDKKDLHHPKIKEKFISDEKLFPIFRKRVVSENKIYSLLKPHIIENLQQIMEEKNADERTDSFTYKLPNDQPSLSRKSQLKKGDYIIQMSCFASINAQNIKLIYLKQSLVRELSKQPENFEDKVVGTFVKIQVGPTDHRQGNHYHLVRVIGVNKEFLLQVSFMPKAIAISELSDDDITELECETLQQKVKDNLLPKITVKELQAKAICLHEEITKHRIAKRLIYLEKRIEYANDKGRLREKDLLIDEKLELERPGKIDELLRELPTVCPEPIQRKCDSDDDSREPDELLL